MPTSSTQSAFLPTAWTDVLNGIQQALAQAIVSATERERAIPATDSDGNSQWPSSVKRCRQRWKAAKGSAAGHCGNGSSPGGLRGLGQELARGSQGDKAKAGRMDRW